MLPDSPATEAPRLLFLSAEAPHSAAAGAIIFLRLFQDYPPDRLLVVTNHLPPTGARRLGCRYEHLPLLADRLNRTRFWSWRAASRALGAPDFLSPRRVDARLDGFQPDIVVTLMQDSWYYDFAARYARRRSLPLVLFIHDLADGFEPVSPWLRHRQSSRDERIYRQAAARLPVSEPMRRHFSETFGVESEVLLPPRSDRPVGQEPEACARLKHPGRLTLGYAGGLHYGYGEQLLGMLPALRATGTRIEMFGPAPSGVVAPLQEATDVFHFNGYISPPEEAWRRIVERCDAVLQPYLNPPAAHERQYRTHFPSKLGDSLSLGLPLLITGPGFASGVQWCAGRTDAALAVTEPGPAPLEAALVNLRDDPALRQRLAAGAQTAARAFDSGALRARLRDILQAIPRRPRA